MKKYFCFLLVLFFSTSVLGQKEIFDIARYNAPKNFKKEAKEQALIYSYIDEKKGNFCVIALHPSSTSSGSPEKDFAEKWKDLILSRYAASADPKTEQATNADGWKSTTGAAIVEQDSIQFYVFLTVFTGFGKEFAISAILNEQSYTP